MPDLDPNCFEKESSDDMNSTSKIFSMRRVKGIDYCIVEIIKGLTDKGQFQYLTNLKGPQVGNYLYTTQFLSLRYFIINYLIPSLDHFIAPVGKS